MTVLDLRLSYIYKLFLHGQFLSSEHAQAKSFLVFQLQQHALQFFRQFQQQQRPNAKQMTVHERIHIYVFVFRPSLYRQIVRYLRSKRALHKKCIKILGSFSSCHICWGYMCFHHRCRVTQSSCHTRPTKMVIPIDRVYENDNDRWNSMPMLHPPLASQDDDSSFSKLALLLYSPNLFGLFYLCFRCVLI